MVHYACFAASAGKNVGYYTVFSQTWRHRQQFVPCPRRRWHKILSIKQGADIRVHPECLQLSVGPAHTPPHKRHEVVYVVDIGIEWLELVEEPRQKKRVD